MVGLTDPEDPRTGPLVLDLGGTGDLEVVLVAKLLPGDPRA